VPSDFGGTRNGMVVSWPKGIKAKNEIRAQFGHVIDVAPTVLQAIGLPEPKSVNGVKQIPMEGTSLAYTFENAKAKERHTTQYFEVAGNRAIYHDGWYARTIHRAPWEPKPRRPLKDNSAWELYDVRTDFSLANDLAAKNPKKVAYDGGGPSKGGKGTLLVDGEKVSEGRIGVTQAGLFSADETADVGIDLGTPVVEAIGAEAKSRFTGRIPKLTVQVK
jgi:arylsulfatase A-like enzyme